MKESRKTVVIDNGFEQMELALDLEGGKYTTTLKVNGVFCHLEAMDTGQFMASCTIDDDPDYAPKLDEQGYAFLLIPFAE